MTVPDGTTILVADDDALIRGALRMALTRAGYTVHEASTASETLAQTVDHHPALVVLDLHMPGGAASETLHSLRTHRDDLAILVLSGDDHPPAELTGPHSDFVQKPIDLDELLARVSQLLTGSSTSS